MATAGVRKQRGIKCPKCRMTLPPQEELVNEQRMACIRCGTPLFTSFFPAIYQQKTGSTGTDVMSDQEASCFYHDQKRAITVCDHCGRFLCALCEVDWHKQTLCPDCITRGRRRRGGRSDMASSRTRYDTMALILGVAPVIIFPLWILMWLTIPAALAMAIIRRNDPCSFLPGRHRKLRFRLGIAGALLQIPILLYMILTIMGEF